MKHSRQHGFSLMELIVVVGILTLLLGIVFTTIANVQQRVQTESQRVDVTQSSREFIDQIERDLRNVGYPNERMFEASVLTSPKANSPLLAAGMVAASSTDIWFEGDLDGSGSVTNVRYTLQADASGNCPCTLKRSALYRSTPGAPKDVLPSYSGELAGVANSIGGTSPWALTGTGRGGTADDSFYAGYKAEPVFRYYGKDNNPVPVPDDLSTAANLSAAITAAPNIAYVVVTVNVLSSTPDQQTGLRVATAMQTSVRLSNLL